MLDAVLQGGLGDPGIALGPVISVRSPTRKDGRAGAQRVVSQSSNRSRADAPVPAVLRPEDSLPFRDSARSGFSGRPDGDLCVFVAELVRLSRVLPTVSRICHFCDSSTRALRRNAAGAGGSSGRHGAIVYRD